MNKQTNTIPDLLFLNIEMSVVSFWVYFSGNTILNVLAYTLMFVIDSEISNSLNV